MELNNLTELMEDELKDLYNAESQLIKALPKMAKRANAVSLKNAFTSHLTQTEQHVKRLDEIGQQMGFKLTGKRCRAMEGLVEEGKEAIDEKGEPAVIDAALIGAAQRVEHYEMAAYGATRAMAEQLGLTRVVDLLQSTLDEERAADQKLTQIAEGEILAEASALDDNAKATRAQAR